jgi:hypothetical protein
MKNLIFIFFAVITMSSCASNKAVIEEEAEVVEAIDPNAVKGIIRDHSMQDCGFLIEVKLDSEVILLEPLDLPETYAVDGKSIVLVYRLSRRPSTCLKGMPIIIDKIID